MPCGASCNVIASNLVFLSRLKPLSFRLLCASLKLFGSIGILLTTAFVFLLFDFFAREENSQLELLSQMQRLEIEGNFHRQIDAMYADMRRWRHDYKNHTLSLAAMLENGEEDKALEYLRQMSEEPCRVEETLNIPNMALNAIVSTKLTYARSKDIDITLSVAYPEYVPINDTDICSIVGNMLDNAIEACERITYDKRFLAISIVAKKKMLLVTVRNSATGIKTVGGKFVTSKNGPYHGLGIQLIDDLVGKYQGYSRREYSEGVFLTQVILPI
jgi:sensor histidine kinase regulating citrate/malate metabolism